MNKPKPRNVETPLIYVRPIALREGRSLVERSGVAAWNGGRVSLGAIVGSQRAGSKLRHVA